MYDQKLKQMKIKIGILIVLLTISHLMNGQTTGWNNIGGNWQKNGYVDVAGPTTDSILWETSSAGIFGAPLYIEGNYLVTMRFQTQTNAPVECYDLTSGNLLWSVDVTNNSGRSLPVGLRDNRVYVMRLTESQNDSLYGLNVTDGSKIWTSNVNVAAYISESGVFDSTGNFYIYGNLKTYKINPANGQMIWLTQTVPMASGSGEMAINQQNNTGYTLEQNAGVSYVWAINLTSGLKKYSLIVPELQAGGNMPQSPLMVGNNGIIYVQLTEDNVSAISDDGTQLNLLWQTEIYGNSSFSTMCVGSDGSIYAPSDGKIIRLNPLTGSIVDSSATITQGGFYSPRISATKNNIIYATNGEDGVYAFDLSLNMLWSDVLNFTNTSGVCFATNGLAAVSGSNKIRVYTPAITTGTSEINHVLVRVYPNPTNNIINIEGLTKNENNTIQIFDVQGKLVITKTITEKGTIDLSELNKGVYVIKIGEVAQRIVKM